MPVAHPHRVPRTHPRRKLTASVPGGTFRYAFTHDCADDLATGCALHDDPANPWEIQPQYPGALVARYEGDKLFNASSGAGVGVA